MSFINQRSTIIRRSNKEMFFISSENGVSIDYYDKHNNIISSNKIIEDSNIDFSSSYFTLDSDDNIYGVYNDGSLKMIEIPNGYSTFTKKEIMKYDKEKFNILFPYIFKSNNSIHLIYYVYLKNSTNNLALFHHYKHNGIWSENKIDFINHIVVDDFTVIWSQDCPIVFYFNLVDGYEELFFSRFNSSTVTWSNPIQVTNSRKNKLYLSILKDNMNFYHITFCENVGNGYSVKYLNGYLNENSLDINISAYITGPSTCIYPSFLKEKSNLYLMWVNYNKLNTSISNSLGKEWSEHNIDEYSIEEDFVRAKFFSNYTDDKLYSSSSVFTTYNDIGILGF